MPLKFENLPPETIEEILLLCDPIDVASVGQCSRSLAILVCHPPDQHLWRELYLSQSLDDPRECYTQQGERIGDQVDWKAELGPIIRARTVMQQKGAVTGSSERCAVLRTLIKLITQVPMKDEPGLTCESRNIKWVLRLLKDWPYLDETKVDWESSEEEVQLRAQLHTFYGLTEADADPEARIASRAFVYSWRNHTYHNEFGPFTGGDRVNWVHMQAIHHAMASYVNDMGLGQILPMNMSETQIVAMEDDTDPRDWAGVTGTWLCSFCFVDHTILRKYNESAPPEEPLDTSLFSSPDFREVFRTLSVTLQITGTKHDPDHPNHPEIFFGRCLDHAASDHTMIGKICTAPSSMAFRFGGTGTVVLFGGLLHDWPWFSLGGIIQF